MDRRTLGELTLPRIVLGTMAYGTHRAPEHQVATIVAALDAGLSALDTAPLYHFGQTEALLGRALRGRPDVQVLGKVGIRWDDDARGDVMLRAHLGGRTIVARKDARPVSVRRDVETSLTRLGRDALDLCQVHHPDPHTPIADTMGELLRLRAEGKVRAIGVSNMSPAQLGAAQAALGDVPLSSHQLQYSLLAPRGALDLQAAAARAVGTLVYSPLHRGALSGRASARGRLHAHDPRRRRTAFVRVNAQRIDAALEAAVVPVARRLGASVAQVVLAWTLRQPHVDALVVGIGRPEQAARTAEACRLSLDPQEAQRIAWAFASLALDPRAQPGVRARIEASARRLAGALLRRARRR